MLRWRDDEDAFAAWCAGETGYPVVDAGMRELARTGFMHNRARMITAAPYFRVFNPTLQGRRFNPEGRYVKRWLPEIEELPKGIVHQPTRPIVSHTAARVRALRAFQEAKARAEEEVRRGER